MKKLLLVLLVAALASFLFVGCLPTTPTEGEGEGEGKICPTVAVTSQVAVGGKTYIKAGSQTITVTFAVPTEPVSVFVGSVLTEVVMYANADKTVYTGTFAFSTGDSGCAEAYIYVETCGTCTYCKYPYTVDSVGPASQIEITSKKCTCTGCDLTFKTPTQTTTCGVTGVCCGDACSGFASYAIDLYTTAPFGGCCDIPCATPAYSCPAGVACPIDCTLSCITGTKEYYVVVTLLDNVGNKTRYYATVELDSACGVTVKEYTANLQTGLCSDYTVEKTLPAAATIGACKQTP